MERFLYSADHRLSTYKTKNPLLIFRNDGGAARVAKTMAIKSYSSGPRGGMEGVREMAKHYGYSEILSYDVGGTTTDIGIVKDGVLASDTYGLVEGVEVSFPLCNIFSAGVGGSSILAVSDGNISVGPESVGAAPGPACFGLGGKQATITDVFLLLGVLDPKTYFGGELNLDLNRSKEAVMTNVGEPLGITLESALEKMLNAWVQKIADSLNDYSPIHKDTTLSGFGGAGALAATRIADATGAKRVIIPGLGAVYSAVGIGFSPISQTYQLTLSEHTDAALACLISDCRKRATKDMYAEGVDFDECKIEITLNQINGDNHKAFSLSEGSSIPSEISDSDEISLTYEAKKSIRGMKFNEVGNEEIHEPKLDGLRSITLAGKSVDVPVVRLEEQTPGASIAGPAIIEEAFFTGLVDTGWLLKVSGNQDIILEKIV
jgi:N-methylhydantoinase A/oxoprolinase/acetone carboxylase beta subunit